MMTTGLQRVCTLGIAAAFVVCSCGNVEKEILIPRQKIQETVQKRFPIEHNALVARATLSPPQVYFQGQNTGVKLDYSANLLAKSLKGTVDFNGLLAYRGNEGAFYLENIVIESITANDAKLSEEDTIWGVVKNLLSNYAAKNPVYVLNQDETREQVAKMLMKRIGVRDDHLVVVLGPPEN
jgi:hypothetical protein